MITRHTNGPWHAMRQGIEIQSEENVHEIMANIGEAHGIGIARVPCSGDLGMMEPDGKGGSLEYASYTVSEAEALANLYLLAAAPELLEVLTAIIQSTEGVAYRHKTELPFWILEARAVVAKATGEHHG